MKKVIADVNQTTIPYRHPERCQACSMCAAPPNADLPLKVAESYGRLRLVRYHVCLDEVYDFRNDTFRFDYPIGHFLFEDEPRKWRAYWERTFRTQTSMKELMKNFADNTDDILLGIWRYERDVLDGLVTWEQYERAIETTIEHYKDFCPNIRYIEFSNECYYWQISSEQYYKLYSCVVRSVNRLNQKHHYEKPLLVGGNAIDSIINRPHLWWEFLKIYAEDTNPEKRLDFYTFHDYHVDHGPRLHQMIAIHKAFLKKLNLPEKPMFFDEFGHVCPARGDLTSNLKNAAGVLVTMIASLPYENLELFPWCTFHNPDSQMCYTHFLEKDGKYIETPMAHAMQLLSKIDGEVVPYTAEKETNPVSENVLIVKGKDAYYVLAVNLRDRDMFFDITLTGMKETFLHIVAYMVDEELNNCLTGNPEDTTLYKTRNYTHPIDGSYQLEKILHPHAFCLWIIKEAEEQ